MQLPIYLDYASTTPVDPRVAESMARCLTRDGIFGNPSSHTHAYGRAAERIVEAARAQVAALVNADSEALIWTSGATESNNLALQGAAHYHRDRGRHLVTAKTEHKAVLDVCRQLEREGFRVTYLDPEPSGRLDLDRLAAALGDDTILVSIMHINNETGVIQDVAAIGELTRRRGILLHVDAAQSLGKIPIDLARMAVDLMSFSAHKLYGPKGIGALYVRRRPRLRLQPLLHGGGQEGGLRAGTLPTHQIAGMGEACRLALEELPAEAERVRRLRKRLWNGLRRLPAVHLNGDPQQRAPGILNVSFDGVAAESLLPAMMNVAAAAGSACTSADREPSHVLRAMGLPVLRMRGAVRLSLGRFTTEAEIDGAIDGITTAVNRLRALSPLWEMQQAGIDPERQPWPMGL
jgi:cysteine desulfurase